MKEASFLQWYIICQLNVTLPSHPPFNHGKATTCHLTTEHKPLNGQFGSEEVAQLFYHSPMTKRVAAWSTALDFIDKQLIPPYNNTPESKIKARE